MCIQDVIKTITKFSNIIGSHQPDFSTNRTVYASYLKLEGIIGQLKRQFTRHTCVSGQNASYACAIVSHFAELMLLLLLLFFLMKTYNRCLVSFSHSVIVLINW